MKKTLLLAITLFIALPHCLKSGNNATRGVVKTMQKRVTKNSKNAYYWRYALGAYCMWLALPYITQYCTFDDSVATLGHDPHISDIPLAHETNKTPVITSMGLPDPAEMYAGKFDTSQSFTVTCRFRDTAIREKTLNPLNYCKAFRSVSIGQEADAETLLYTVIRCYERGHRKVHVFGNSRGGAVIIKMLDILSNPKNYEKTWDRFNITNPSIQEEIRAIVGAGTIYLAHPLMNYRLTINRRLATFLAPAGTTIDKGLSYCGPLGKLVTQVLHKIMYPLAHLALCYSTEQLLKIATDYNAQSTDPLTIITHNIYKQTWPYNITIALAHDDEVVGNTHDALLTLMSIRFHKKLLTEPGGKDHRDIRELIKKFRKSLTESIDK